VMAALGLALLAGCGSDDESSDSASQTTEAEQPSRGFNLQDSLKAGCKAIGGNYNFSQGICFLDSETEVAQKCKDGKLSILKCVADPATKEWIDDLDAQYGNGSFDTRKAVDKCEAVGGTFSHGVCFTD
jgi:hypothetical protein